MRRPVYMQFCAGQREAGKARVERRPHTFARSRDQHTADYLLMLSTSRDGRDEPGAVDTPSDVVGGYAVASCPHAPAAVLVIEGRAAEMLP
jgi:hypothetical protein